MLPDHPADHRRFYAELLSAQQSKRQGMVGPYARTQESFVSVRARACTLASSLRSKKGRAPALRKKYLKLSAKQAQCKKNSELPDIALRCLHEVLDDRDDVIFQLDGEQHRVIGQHCPHFWLGPAQGLPVISHLHVRNTRRPMSKTKMTRAHRATGRMPVSTFSRRPISAPGTCCGCAGQSASQGLCMPPKAHAVKTLKLVFRPSVVALAQATQLLPRGST